MEVIPENDAVGGDDAEHLARDLLSDYGIKDGRKNHRLEHDVEAVGLETELRRVSALDGDPGRREPP
ncbi:MAG TPA: hypothetical protein VF061_12115, partial [Gemmatimonadales bacterium]